MPLGAKSFLFLVIATASVAQTATDLTARYGYPDVERFVVRPGITMMASYAEDRTACEMVIEPKHPIHRTDDKEQLMETATVSEIIDELIPKSERGILLDRIFEAMGAPQFEHDKYQNVTISRYFVRSLPANHDEKSATIIRKDGPCSPAIPSHESVPAIELNAADLHARYGEPDVERFIVGPIVRPNVTLMVAYGTDRAACQMVVERMRSIIPHDEPAEYMRPEVVTEIIDVVLPEADRGSLLLRTVTKSGCNEIENADYQNVTVSRFRHKCNLPNPGIEVEATVTLKNAVCGNGGK